MTSLGEAAEALAGGDVVAFTGAGMSAEAGIPTFRDPGGVWDRFDPEVYGTWEGLARAALETPDGVASFLAELRRVFAGARPTPGHVALVELEGAGLLTSVVTQNVDGLHQEAGSTTVVEIHGSFARLAGLVCPHREEIGRERFVAMLDHAVTGLRSAFVPSLASILPRCAIDGAPMRPDFVAFGEAPHDLAEAERLVRAARTLLVVGTSGEVYPAAALPGMARAAGALVVEVGKGRTAVPADVRIDGDAGTVLPRLVTALTA